jgi:hypothetical protein
MAGLLACAIAGVGLCGCGGASTGHRDPVTPPPPIPNADVGQRRAAQDAALATEARSSTQRRTDAAVGAGEDKKP